MITTPLASAMAVATTELRPVEALHPNPLNPRAELDPAGLNELADSMRAQGILQPLLVTPEGMVVAGHRRLAAARLAGINDVPVVVRELTELQQLEIMLVENLQRQDLSPVDEARAYRRMLDSGQTTAQLARKLGVPAARINARLVLLRLDDKVQWMFHRGDLPLTLASVLLRVSDPIRQHQIAARAARRQLTTSDIERIVDRGLGALHSPAPATSIPAEDLVKHGLSPSRVVALENLTSSENAALSLRDLAEMFRDTCCACGAEDLPTYCTACPMLDLVNRVLARVTRSR